MKTDNLVFGWRIHRMVLPVTFAVISLFFMAMVATAQELPVPRFLQAFYQPHASAALDDLVNAYQELDRLGADLAAGQKHGRAARSKFNRDKKQLIQKASSVISSLSLQQVWSIIMSFESQGPSIARKKYSLGEVDREVLKVAQGRYFVLLGKEDPELFTKLFRIDREVQLLWENYWEEQRHRFGINLGVYRDSSRLVSRSDTEKVGSILRDKRRSLKQDLKSVRQKVQNSSNDELKTLYGKTAASLTALTTARDMKLVPFYGQIFIFAEAMEMVLNADYHPLAKVLGNEGRFRDPNAITRVGIEELGYLSNPESAVFLYEVVMQGHLATSDGTIAREYDLAARIKAVEALGNLGVLASMVLEDEKYQELLETIESNSERSDWQDAGEALFGSDANYESIMASALERMQRKALPASYTVARFLEQKDRHYTSRRWPEFLPDAGYFFASCAGFDEDPEVQKAKMATNAKWGVAAPVPMAGRFVRDTCGFVADSLGNSTRSVYAMLFLDFSEEDTYRLLRAGPRGVADGWFNLIPLVMVGKGGRGIAKMAWQGGRIALPQVRAWIKSRGGYGFVEGSRSSLASNMPKSRGFDWSKAYEVWDAPASGMVRRAQHSARNHASRSRGSQYTNGEGFDGGGTAVATRPRTRTDSSTRSRTETRAALETEIATEVVLPEAPQLLAEPSVAFRPQAELGAVAGVGMGTLQLAENGSSPAGTAQMLNSVPGYDIDDEAQGDLLEVFPELEEIDGSFYLEPMNNNGDANPATEVYRRIYEAHKMTSMDFADEFATFEDWLLAGMKIPYSPYLFADAVDSGSPFKSMLDHMLVDVPKNKGGMEIYGKISPAMAKQWKAKKNEPYREYRDFRTFFSRGTMMTKGMASTTRAQEDLTRDIAEALGDLQSLHYGLLAVRIHEPGKVSFPKFGADKRRIVSIAIIPPSTGRHAVPQEDSGRFSGLWIEVNTTDEIAEEVQRGMSDPQTMKAWIRDLLEVPATTGHFAESMRKYQEQQDVVRQAIGDLNWYMSWIYQGFIEAGGGWSNYNVLNANPAGRSIRAQLTEFEAIRIMRDGR